MMICAWTGGACHKPNCEHCAVRERERNIRNIEPLHFVYCTVCVKANECKMELYLDGCHEGVAFYEEDRN